MNYCVIRNDYLEHHGILGMKWGVRRYQNEDGSLTEAGKKRYLNSDGSLKPNKTINARDLGISQVLSRVEKKSGKNYALTEKQKKYMDESGNLTLEGGRKTLPYGYDLSSPAYKPAEKAHDDYSNSWKKYWNDRTDENFEEFLKKQEIYFKELDEINVEIGRRWILNHIK